MTPTKTQFKLWAVAAFSTGTLVVGVLWQTILDRNRTIDLAERDLGQLAKHLEVNAAATFNAATLLSDHISTITLSDLGEDSDPTPEARQQWVDVLGSQPFVSSVAFIRPDGVVPIILIRSNNGEIRSLEQRMDVSNRVHLLCI